MKYLKISFDELEKRLGSFIWRATMIAALFAAKQLWK